MARFYGEVSGKAVTDASREGSEASGITAHIRGWDVGIKVRGYVEEGKDTFEITVTRGSNDGSRVCDLAEVIKRDDGIYVLQTGKPGIY